MTSPDPASNCCKPLVSMISVALTGMALGWMVGLSVSEVTGSVVAGVLAAATGFLTLTIKTSKKDKPDRGDLIENAQWKLAVFSVAIALTATGAAVVRGDPNNTNKTTGSGPFLYADELSKDLCSKKGNASLDSALGASSNPLIKRMVTALKAKDKVISIEDVRATVRVLCEVGNQ